MCKNPLDGENWWHFKQLNISIHMMGLDWSRRKKKGINWSTLLVSVSLYGYWYWYWRHHFFNDTQAQESVNAVCLVKCIINKRMTLNLCVFLFLMFRFFDFTKCRDNQVPFLCNDITVLRDNEPSILPCDWESDEGGSPPPDYNSAFLYPSL